MMVLWYLLLLVFVSGTQACLGRPKPKPTCNCGLALEDAGKDTRIMGGRPASPHEFPFMARIYRKMIVEFGTDTTKVEVCGGSLISKDTILTAAHCVSRDSDPANYHIWLGDHDRTVTESGEQTPTVVSVHAYEKYFTSKDHDYGIIKLKADEVIISETVSTVCLPTNDNYDNERFTIAMGWGVHSTSTSQPIPALLQKVSLVSETQSWLCEFFTQFLVQPHQLTDRTMCLYGERNEVEGIEPAICDGDSGGPVVTLVDDGRGNRRYVQTGIISQGGQQVRDCRYSIAARVSNPEALEWIKEMSDENCNSPIS